MNQTQPPPRFGPLFYSVLSTAIVLVVVVRVLPWLGVDIALFLYPGTYARFRWPFWLPFWQLVYAFPEALAWIVGSFLFIKRWKRHPRVSKCALLGIGGLMAVATAGFLLDMWLNSISRSGVRWSHDATITYQMLRMLLTLVLKSACWILVFAAILGWRGDATHEVASPDAEE